MDERLRKLRLERGQALLESCRMRDFDRSPEETARLKQRGRFLYEERLRAEEKGSPYVEMRYHSDAVIDLCSIPVKEGQVATEKTHGLSYVLPQSVELLSESRRDGDNISTSNDCTTTIIDYSILDSVREQHIRDVRQIEILTKESHLLQETIEKQQEALTKLAAELAQRDAQIQCNLKNDTRKLLPPDEKETGVWYDGGTDHMQEMVPAMRPRAQDNRRNPHLETSEDFHEAESLLARKQVEIKELQLKLQEKILYCNKLGEENKNLNKNKQQLQEDVVALLKIVCMIQEELINTTEQGNFSQKTVIYLEHKITQMQSEYKPHTPVPESTHMEEEIQRLARQCADAEATMHRMEAEMAAENAMLKEELCRMQQSHEEEIEAALLEAGDRIAEHDDLLRHKLEEQEAELEARFLEQLNSFKEPGGDSDALHSLLSLKEENAKLKEELCRMQQSHEEERQAAGAAMHRMEAEMRSQQQTQLAGPPRRAAASSTNPFASMGALSKEPGSFPDQGDDGDDVFGVGTEQHPTATGDAVSGDRQAEPEGLVTELRGRLAELEAALSSATLARDSAVGEVERLARQCADAEATMHRMEAEMAAENAKLKEELCRMQQSHEEERQAAGAAMHRMEAEMRSQQQTQLAGPPRRAAASSTNPFASMGALSKEPGSFPDQGDDGDDVFGVGTEQHPTATGDAVSGDRQAEPEGLVTELRGRLAELEAALSSATLARDSAVGEVERLARQCADAEATMHRMEAEMAAENAKLKEELCRMQQSHEEERQAAGAAMHRMEAEMRSQQQTQLAGPPRRAAASSTNPFASMGALSKEPGSFPDQGDDGDDVFGVGTEQHPTATGDAVSGDRQAEPEGLVTELRGRLAELEAALSSATLARDSAVGEVERLARQCADAEATMHRMEAEMAAENAMLKEELCRMQQSHEEERQAAGAAMHRMEAEMRSQQQTQLAGPPRRAAASSTNPFASMGALSKEPGSFPDQGDDGDDVFGVGTEQHPTATGDAVSGDRQAEPEGLVTELRGRLAELEAALSSATLARDSAVGEVERLARQCADAEATMHRMEAEMAAENAKLKEELCRMQQSHEEEIEAALLEAGDRIAEHDDLLRHKLEEQEAELEARFLEQLNSFKEPGGDSDALHSLLSLKEENAKLKEELCRMQQSHEEERQAAGAAMHRMEAEMRSQQQTQLAGPPRRAAASSTNPFASMGALSKEPGSFPDQGDDGDDVFGVGTEQHPTATGDAVSGDRQAEPEGLVTELRGRLAELEAALSSATLARDSAVGEVERLARQCADAEATMHRMEAEMAAENAMLKEELCRMQQSHEEERQAAGAAMHRMEAEMRSQQQTQLAGPPRRAAASSTNPFASMGALSKEPGSFPDQGDDGDDVFGVGTEQHPTATGDAVSGDRQAEPEGLVTELRGRLAELEAALSSATLARDSAVGEVERLARQCADAEATMHRMEAEMAAENAMLKEELCRMQQSHEEERQAAGAAMHRMEAEMRSQQQTQLAGPPRRAAASSTNPFASMGALSKEPGSFPDQGDDGDDVFGVGTEQHPTATGDAVSGDRQAEPEGLVTELRGRLAELEAALSSATLARDSAVGEVERLARQCADAEATMHRMEAEMAAENAKLKEELCRMQQSHEEEIEAALLEAGDRIAEHDDLLRHKLEEQEAELEARFLEQLNSFKEPGGDSDALHSLLSLKEENAKLKEELCRMQQSHEEERQAAGAAMHRMEAEMRSQQQTQLAGPPRRAAASSTNPFASMGALSKEPGSFPDQGDDGDDVFGVGTEQHPTATGDAVSGDRQAEPEGLVTELRGRLAELEAALSSATLARDSAVGEVERLARQCADAEATMHRMEAEMAAENAKLKEELCRMQQSHEEEIEAALLEAGDRIAEHDDLLRHKLEEQEAELEARFLEQLNSFKEPGGDSDALHSLLSLKEENAKLKEELCRMQQSHEEERQAAGAAMHRMEAEMRSQQQTQLAGPPRRAAASSTNPFASMGALSKEPGSFPDQGDDGDDVFGVGTEQHPTATGDAVSGDRQAEPEGLVTELRGRLAELEAALSSATLARDSAVGEVERLARQCADAEATMHRMEAEMAAENAKLKEELCRMQQSHEEEIEAALLEAGDRIAEHDDLLRHKLEEQEAELEARFLEQLNSFKEPGGDSDALHSLLSLKEENAKLKEELCRMQQSHEEERQAAGAAMHRMEAEMRSQQQTQLAGPPRRAAASSTNPFASMGALSKEPGSFPDQGDDGDDVFGVGTEQHPTATGDAVSGDRQAEPEGLVTELRGRLAELEAALSSATLARDSAVGEVERLARQCADAEATMHRMEAEMAAENAKLKEELCRMQQSHEEEIEAALLEAGDRIAEHDDLLRHKLEEQEAELEARFLEQLNSFKEPGGDSDALHSLLSLKEENAKLKEELCRMQQSHEEERQAAGAAMHRMEAEMRSQQQTQLAGPPRRAAASSTNPFASMGALSKEPGSFPDQGDDGDDVFGVGTEQHPTATGDAVSGDRQAEPEGLVTELRGRLAELEAALSSATLARDSAVGEVERLARQCADAEATMHRMEAEMAAENAKLKEELCRMQQSHEEEIEAALLEAGDRIAEHDDLLRHKLEEQEAELEARFLEQLNSFKEPGGDSDALHSLLSLKEENAKLKEELCRMQQSHEEEIEAALLEAGDRIAEHDDLLRHKLEEQEEYYEKILADKKRLESLPVDNSVLGGALFWKEEHDKLYERFEQLQTELRSYLQDTTVHQDLEAVVRQGTPSEDGTCVDGPLQAALNEVDLLKGQISVLQRTREQEEEKVAMQERDLQELRERLRAEEKSRCEFSQMYEDAAALLRDGATSVEMLLQEKRARIEELESQTEKMSQQVLSTEEQLRFVRVELEQRQQEVDEGTERYFKLEAVHREMGAELREVKLLLEERQRTLSQRLERVQNDMEKQMHDASEEIRRVCCEHEQQENGLRREIDRLRAELQAAQTLAATMPFTAQTNNHQLLHIRQKLDEALSEKMQVVAELEAMQQLLRKKESLSRGRQQGAEDGSEAGDSGQFLDARINSLLQRSESLEVRVQQLTTEKETLLQEKDALELEVQCARRMVEVRELACQRQTDEVKQSRTQIAAMKDDLSFRIQSCNALRQELNEAQEQAAELARAYEGLQLVTFAERRNLLLREYMEAILLAKAMTVPRVMQDMLHGIMQAHRQLLRRCSENQRNLLARCDAIEQTATEAMVEGERQSNELLSIIEDAKAEQQQLQEIIERLEMELAAANCVARESTEEAAAVKKISTEATKDAREEASKAKSDLQALQLEYNSAVNTISLLETEKANAARIIARANSRLEELAAQQQEEVARLQESLIEKTCLLRDAQEAAKNKLEAVEQQAEEYKAQRDDATKRAQAAQASLDRVLPRLERLEAEQAAREAELMDTTQQLTALSQRSTSTEVISRRQVDALNATLAELRSAHATLSEECTKAHEHITELKNQLTASEAEIGRLRTRKAQQEQEAEAAKARLTELESLYANDTSDAATWRRGAERRSAALESRNSALQEELQASQKQQCVLQERVDLLEAKLRQMSDENHSKDQQQRRFIQQLKERCELLEGEIGKLDEAHAKLSAERDTLHRDWLNAKQDVGSLENHLEATNQHNEQLHKELRRQKESHDAELQMVRRTLADAQEEISRCRCTLVEAEARENELNHVVYALKKEKARCVEELQQMRGLAESEQELLVRERSQRQEQVAELQEEVVQLQKEIHAARQECKGLVCKCTQHADEAELLRRQLTDRTDRCRTLQQDAAAQHEQLTATVKSLRAEVATLQSKLEEAQDTLAQKQREYEQCEERSLRKMEVSRLSEEILRKEVADLQRDVQQLQQKLAFTATAAHDAEKTGAQQQAMISKLTEELERQNTQSTAYLKEREQLQSALRENTSQLERVARKATADLETALAKTNELHNSNVEKLETALRREQQAAQEVRTARDCALESLEERQGECEFLRAEVARLQQMLRSAQAQVASTQAEVRSTVTQVVVEAGLPQEGELSLSSVVNQLLLRLNRLSHAAVLLDVEVSQFKCFEKACEAHAAALRCVIDATRSSQQVPASSTAPTSPLLPMCESSGGSSTHSLRQRSFSSRSRVLQDIISSVSTFAHRLMDHCHTIRGMLDNMEAAVVQCETKFVGDPAVTHLKLVIVATLSELQLRTSRQTAFLSQIFDGAVMSTALQEAILFLRDDETYVLRPFNELLMPSSSSPLSTPRWGGGVQESNFFTKTRVPAADTACTSQHLWRASAKKENELQSRIVVDPRQQMESARMPGEEPRGPSMPATSGAEASVASVTTAVDASTGPESSSANWCVNHEMQDAA